MKGIQLLNAHKNMNTLMQTNKIDFFTYAIFFHVELLEHFIAYFRV